MATRKKAAVAGSVQGPAVADPAQIAASQNENTVLEEVIPQPFPREIIVANDTPMPYIIAATSIGAGAKVPVLVRNDDEIERIKTDCGHLMSLTPAYAELEEQPLRVIDAAAE